MLPGLSFTCSTTRLMTLRGAGAARRGAAAPAVAAAAAPVAAPAAGRGFALRLGAGAFLALLAVVERREEVRAFEELFLLPARLFEAFLLEERFFEAFLLDERFAERFFDDRLPDERFFEDFFEDLEDFRDERFLEAAIWFLLLTRLDRDAVSEKVAGELRCHGNSVARKTI